MQCKHPIHVKGLNRDYAMRKISTESSLAFYPDRVLPHQWKEIRFPLAKATQRGLHWMQHDHDTKSHRTAIQHPLQTSSGSCH